MATLRLVLDTHVLVSGIAYPASVPGKIMTAWRHGSVEVLLAESILDELRRLLPGLAHRHGLSTAEMGDVADILSIQAEIIEPVTHTEPQLGDPADHPVLGALLAALETAKADYLITGDKDLLALSGRHPVTTPADFWSAHGGL